MTLASITVRGTYVGIVSGEVTFTQEGFRAGGGKIYPPVDQPVRVSDDGTFSTTLRGSDVAVVPPFAYQVAEVLQEANGQIIRRGPYVIELPAVASGSVVDLADLQPDGTWDIGDVEAGSGGGSGGSGGFGGSGATGGF